MKKTFFILFSLCLLTPSVVMAKRTSGNKPQWVSKGEEVMNNKRSNSTYHFIRIENLGSNLQDLTKGRLRNLASKIGQENNLSGESEVKIENIQTGNDANSRIQFVESSKNKFKVATFVSRLVDEYWEFDDGKYHYYALFAVSESGQEPVFDEFSSSTSYGAAPIVMSIIPGVGQMYKGSTAKGLCLLGGTAALGLGALFCDNERADYKNKMKEQPQFAQDYNTKANNYETARNVCLGAAAAVWIYNIIDAAVAKGARRIIVKPANRHSFSMAPMISTEGTGVTLAYRF